MDVSSRGESSMFKPSMGKKKAGSGEEGSSWGLSNAEGREGEGGVWQDDTWLTGRKYSEGGEEREGREGTSGDSEERRKEENEGKNTHSGREERVRGKRRKRKRREK